MPPAIYSCTLWRDRNALLGPKQVEVFDTALDLEDPASLQHALVAAVHRHRGQYADMTPYSLQVRIPGESDAILDYRHTPWLDDRQQT
jgi:hypothetical protein